MRRAWCLVLAASLGLVGCEKVGVNGLPLKGGESQPPGQAATADHEELAKVFREALTAQQARQQVNVTSSSLISNNVGTLLSNNGGSLTKNAPLISNGAGSLISNGSGTYRVAVTLPTAPAAHHVLPDGNHFYRFGAIGATLVESFVTRTTNKSQSGFDVPDQDVLVHSRMTVTPGDLDLLNPGKPITNHYRIQVLKSPVLVDYLSDVWISAPLGGATQLYVEKARYRVGALPVTAEATHSAFAAFTVEGRATDLPTSGEERIRMGSSELKLSYQQNLGQGVGTGSWSGPERAAWPLAYTYDFALNVARMTVSLPRDRTLELKVMPGMRVESGVVTDKAGASLATLVKRDDGRIVVRFKGGGEIVLFE